MSINLPLTIAAMTENIRKQTERREKFKSELLKMYPFKKGEAVYLTNIKTGRKREAFIHWIYVSDSGKFIYKLWHNANKSYGIIRQSTDLNFNEVVEKRKYSPNQYKSLKEKFNKQIL